MSKHMSVGVRLFKEKAAGPYDGMYFPRPMIARKTEIYDTDSGKFLPVQKADIHIDPDNLVTVTIEVEVNELDIVETGSAQ